MYLGAGEGAGRMDMLKRSLNFLCAHWSFELSPLSKDCHHLRLCLRTLGGINAASVSLIHGAENSMHSFFW